MKILTPNYTGAASGERPPKAIATPGGFVPEKALCVF